MNNQINLLAAKFSERTPWVAAAVRLRLISYWSGAIILLFTAAVAGGLIITEGRLRSLEDKQSTLTAAIAQSATKEQQILALKNRLTIAEKLIANQFSWKPIFEVIETLISPQELTSWTVDDEQRLTINITAVSLEHALQIMGKIGVGVAEGKIKNPVLSSFTVGENGAVLLGLSFKSAL